MIKPPKRHRFSPTSQEPICVQTSENQSLVVEGLDEELLAAGFQPVPFQAHPKSFMDYLPSFLTPKPKALPAPPPVTASPYPAELSAAATAYLGYYGNPPTDAPPIARPLLKTPARLLSMTPKAASAWKPSARQKLTPPRRPVAFSAGAVALFVLAGILGGMAAGYYLPRLLDVRAASVASAPSQNVAESAADQLTPTQQTQLDAAYTAQKIGKYAEAGQLFTTLQREHPVWGAMGVEVGASQIYRHDLAAARASLEAAAKQGSAVADAKFRLGMLFSIQKEYPKAESSFAKAVALDPSRADYYYFWGECLRQEGKPLEAIGKFQSALLRNQHETSEGLFRLKLWLSEIQANQENADGSGARIKAALATPRPSMEASFAAAAQDLKARDITAAADQLSRARELVAPNIFFVIMHDPSFAQESWRPELAGFFK